MSVSLSVSLQLAPPNCGTGLVQVRVRLLVRVTQALQFVHRLMPPSTEIVWTLKIINNSVSENKYHGLTWAAGHCWTAWSGLTSWPDVGTYIVAAMPWDVTES